MSSGGYFSHLAARDVPWEATILWYCRCRDCTRLNGRAGAWICANGIGGTGVVWGTGERVTQLPADEWHYCAEYDGPRNAQKPLLSPKRQQGRSTEPPAKSKASKRIQIY